MDLHTRARRWRTATVLGNLLKELYCGRTCVFQHSLTPTVQSHLESPEGPSCPLCAVRVPTLGSPGHSGPSIVSAHFAHTGARATQFSASCFFDSHGVQARSRCSRSAHAFPLPNGVPSLETPRSAQPFTSWWASDCWRCLRGVRPRLRVPVLLSPTSLPALR